MSQFDPLALSEPPSGAQIDGQREVDILERFDKIGFVWMILCTKHNEAAFAGRSSTCRDFPRLFSCASGLSPALIARALV
jgi:hypothetical protein